MYKPRLDYYSDQDISDLVPESEKAEAPYLIACADELISRLVTARPDLRHLRDMYEGKRSPKASQHLTDNYGIGNPGRVPFIPIVRNRIEYLKGQYLQSGIPHRVACSNSYSAGVMQQERMDFFMQQLVQRLTADLGPRLQQAQQGQQPDAPAMLKQEEIKKLAEQGQKFQSSLEIAAQRVVTEYITNPELHMLTHMQDHLENLLVEGETGFDTRPGEPGQLATHEVVPAVELYCDVPRKKRFSKNATCFVRRQLMSVQQVLTKWGHKMSRESRLTIAGNHCMAGPWESLPLGAEKYLDFYRNEDGSMAMHSDEYREWVSRNDNSNRNNLVEVFTCQWIATNEVDLLDEQANIPAGVRALGLSPQQLQVGTGHHLQNAAQKKAPKRPTRFRQDLYEVVRIGSNIYPEMGPVINPIRPTHEPWKVCPTFRRYCLDMSLLAGCEDLQNKSDIMHYFAENAGATSGTKGTVTPVSDIPKELGNDIHERIKTAAGYRKIGLALIDPMQAGGTKGQFSNYQSFDDTLKGDTLTGFKTFIDGYDESASNVTGVNRQMLGAIAERDGKAVTEQAVTGGTVVTKPIFTLFDILIGEALGDGLNYSRQSLKAGSNSNNQLLLGQTGRNAFTMDTESFSMGYFHVYVRDGQKERKQLESMTNMAKEFVAAQQLAPEEAIDSLFMESVTEAREHLVGKLRENTAEKMQQLTQENDQLKQQVEQLTKAQQQSGGLEQQIAQQELANDSKRVAIEERAQATDARQGDELNALKGQEVALQRDQALAAASESAEKVSSIK